MYPVSSRYAAAIPVGYTIASKVRVLSGGSTVDHISPDQQGTNTVTVSRSDSTRRRCTMSVWLNGTSLIPGSDYSGELTPFGNEIQPFFGIRYPDGSTELVPMGVFAIGDVQVDDTISDLRLTLTGYDRSWVVATRKLKAPYIPADGTAGTTVIHDLVNQVYSGLTYNITPSSATVPGAAFKEGDDPWAAVLTIAEAIGYEAFFDVNGIMVARPIPDPTTQPSCWTYREGARSGMKGLSRRLTRQGVYNDFIVSGSGSNVQPPVRAEAQDTDSASPTYVSGSFGDVPSYVESSLVTTTAAAQAAANNLLAAAKGSAEQLDLTVNPNPAHDIDDVVTVVRSRAGVNGRYVVDGATFTAGHGGSTLLNLRRAA